MLISLLLVVLVLPVCNVYGWNVIRGKQHVDIKSIVRRQLIGTLSFSLIGLSALELMPPSSIGDSVDVQDRQQEMVVSGKKGTKYYNRGDILRANSVRNWDYYKSILEKNQK